MNFWRPSLTVVACVNLAISASADTIVLKSGEKIEGRILREDADCYVVEVKVTGSIRDEKILARSDVRYVEKEKPDETAYVEIKGLVPAPELLSKQGYETRIEKLEAFVKEHPSSKRVKEVKAMIDILVTELGIVGAGGIKIGEEMISAGDYEADAYAYDVRIADKQIKDAVSRLDLLSCLRKFTAYGERFGQPEGYAGLSALMTKVLKSYRASLNENLANLDKRIEKRQAGLASMTTEDRANTERALKEEMESAEKRFNAEKSSGEKWITPDEFHKESMTEALREVEAEISKLAAPTIGVQPAVSLAETYRITWEKLGFGTPVEKEKILTEAKTNGLSEFYLEKLRVRAGLVEK